jgi:N-acyl homoserine lactone hydrolase
MTAKLYAMTCGRLIGRLKDMIEGEDGPVALPIPSYLIEHPRGRALFDTGMHPQCRTDAVSASGWRASSASSSTVRATT